MERARIVRLIVGFVLFSIVFMNAFAFIATPSTVLAETPEGVAESAVAGIEMIRPIGSLATPTGLGIAVVTMVLLALAFGLLNARNWEVGAMFFLGADITLKLVNVISVIATGDALVNTLLTLGIVAVEAGLILALYRRYAARRGMKANLSAV